MPSSPLVPRIQGSRCSPGSRPDSRSYSRLSQVSAIDIEKTRTARTTTTTITAVMLSAERLTSCEPTHSATSGAPVQRLMARKAVAATIAVRLASRKRVGGGGWLMAAT